MNASSAVLLLIALVCILQLEQSRAAMTQAQMKQAMKTVRNMCLPKTGASKEALDKMMVGDFDDEDRKLKCYLGCVMGMMQAVKKGKIDLKMIRGQAVKMLSPEFGAKVLAAFESCQNTEGSDNCDLAYNFAKCIYETDKEVQLQADVLRKTRFKT